MTVYYQFGSLGGLLEALSDSLAIAGGMNHLAEAFRLADPLAALDRFIAVFTGFWESDRLVIRALQALAALDPEFGAVLEERSGWRRKGVRVLVERLSKKPRRGAREMSQAADLLYMLTSFSTYDMLADDKRSRDEVTLLLQQLGRLALS
jgi:AcrR family transcriptional regulator